MNITLHLVLDSSGRTPHLTRATITSLGEYDQCLSITHNEIRGSYCLLDIVVLKRNDGAAPQSTVQKFDLATSSAWKGYPFAFGVCIPHRCHLADLKQLLNEALESFDLQVRGHASCEQQTADEPAPTMSTNQVIS